jgi:hypothetical protein
MRIFHHFLTFTYKIAVPVKLFSPQTIYLPNNGHHVVKYDLKLISMEAVNPLMVLSNNDFSIRYLGATSIELFLQKAPLNSQGMTLIFLLHSI